MKFYKHITFKPRLGSDPTKHANTMLNQMAWLEDVGCTVLNHIKRDKLLRTGSIVKILDAAGRRDLIPGMAAAHEVLSDPEQLRKASCRFGARMASLFPVNNQLFPGNIMVARLTERPQGCDRPTPMGKYWYHIVPSPDYFIFGEGGLLPRKRMWT